MKKACCSLLILLTSCMPGIGHKEEPALPGYNFAVKFPEEWRRLDSKRFLILTKGDPFLQYILIQQRHADKEFKHTKRKIRRDMLPEEAAEVVLDEMTLDGSVMDFRLVKNEPIKVNQYDGFELVFTYSTRGGRHYRTMYCGLIEGDWFYSLRYNASERSYSERDIHAFLKMVRSFKILHVKAL